MALQWAARGVQRDHREACGTPGGLVKGARRRRHLQRRGHAQQCIILKDVQVCAVWAMALGNEGRCAQLQCTIAGQQQRQDRRVAAALELTL
jgi:hypothetical protein